MTSDLLSTSTVSQSQPAALVPVRRPRVWPAVVLTGLFWALYAAVPWLEMSMFASFLIRLGVCAVVWLLFLGWWAFNGSVSRTERFLGFVGLLGIGTGSWFLLDKSMPAMAWSTYCLPLVLTAWTLWLALSRWLAAWPRQVGMLGVFALTFGAFTLIRMEGLEGDGQSVFHWRWTPSAKGSVLWEYKVPSRGPGLPRSIQPHLAGTSQILIGSEGDFGTILLDVDRDGDSWKVVQRWRSRELRPPFNDFVIHEGFIYGFDKTRFCCVDLQTGKERWKDGDYGQGQVMLLADQGLLLVASESGDAIVLAANSERHEELGRIKAIGGKTWNHPVVAHGKLYLRSNEELACFQLPEKEGK